MNRKRLLLNLFRILNIWFESSFILIVSHLHLNFSCHSSSKHKSTIALWYSYIVVTRYRTTHWDIEMKGEQKWATNEMKWDRKKEKSDRRTKGIPTFGGWIIGFVCPEGRHRVSIFAIPRSLPSSWCKNQWTNNRGGVSSAVLMCMACKRTYMCVAC